MDNTNGNRGDRRPSHGDATHTHRAPEYTIWAMIKARCGNPREQSYPNYGGRGITICDAWRKNYEAFLADVGRRPSAAHSIDRIDVNGNYEPGNVKWSTRFEQHRNTRRNRFLTLNGVTHCLSDWSQITGISRGTLNGRLYRGWSDEAILTTPLIPRGRVFRGERR